MNRKIVTKDTFSHSISQDLENNDSIKINIIPNGWDIKKLGELTETITKGTTPTTYGFQYTSNGIHFLKVESIGKFGEFITENFAYINEDTHKALNRSILKENDILISIAGALGRIAIVNENILPANINQAIAIIRIKDKNVDLKYLKYFLQSDFIQNNIKLITTQSAQPNLNLNQLGNFTIIIPKIVEQCKIAAILSTIDELIESTERIIVQTEQIKKRILQELLTKGVNNTEFKDTEFGKVPKDWSVSTLGYSCSLIQDGTHLPPKRVNDGPLLLSVQNMIGGNLKITSSDTRVSWDFYKSMHKKWEIHEGDVLLAVVGATIGKTAVVQKMEPFTIQRSICVLRGQRNILENDYLHLYLTSNTFQNLLIRSSNQTAQPGIYLAELSKLKIPLPNIEEQHKITAITSSINMKINFERNYKNKLKFIKKGLMQVLLTGKVRVKVDS